jgi:hypothetical protein
MKRCFAILILLVSCNGCMMFDDLYLDQPTTQTQPNSCGLPATVVPQTQEPPR